MTIQSIDAADVLASVARSLINNGFRSADLQKIWADVCNRADVWADYDATRVASGPLSTKK